MHLRNLHIWWPVFLLTQLLHSPQFTFLRQGSHPPHLRRFFRGTVSSNSPDRFSPGSPRSLGETGRSTLSSILNCLQKPQYVGKNFHGQQSVTLITFAGKLSRSIEGYSQIWKTRLRTWLSQQQRYVDRPIAISVANVRQACRWSNANFTQPQATSEPTKCLVGGNSLFASRQMHAHVGLEAAKIDQAWPICARAFSSLSISSRI